jgi:hypothetical protein
MKPKYSDREIDAALKKLMDSGDVTCCPCKRCGVQVFLLTEFVDQHLGLCADCRRIVERVQTSSRH